MLNCRARRSRRGSLSDRLNAERPAPRGEGHAALDRDPEIHRLTGRLHTARAQL